MFQIDRFDFKTESLDEISTLRHWGSDVGKNWPVVYIINNDKEAYVGETVSAYQRFDQHLKNPDRCRLTEVRILSDKDFNKSVTLDLESFLIRHMASDGKYKLQNGNGGLQNHAYYDRNEYENRFKELWNKLRQLHVVDNTISEIENSELYKYSPYKCLGEEQIKAEREIVKAIAEYTGEGHRASIVVRGGAGTGKTILAIYLMKLFVDLKDENPLDDPSIYDILEEDAESVYVAESIRGLQKIGIVMPQKSLQSSIKTVFSSISSLSPDMVLSPAEVVKNVVRTGVPYDLLIVDESHRLKCRDKGHLANYRVFDQCNSMLGLDPVMGTELDWIMQCSHNQILFRDELQTVRPCDIDAKRFHDIVWGDLSATVLEAPLSTQWRCEGGNDYIEYIKRILSGIDQEMIVIDNYDLRLYTNCAQMVADIKKKNSELGLCRVVAGYAWPWDRKHVEELTINIQGEKYQWNTTYNNWIVKDSAINEIGCIHTVQGYDLNYVGVIIGEDIQYDPIKKCIIANKNNYYDQQGKSGVANDPDALCQYLCNIYLTLLTRGIKGTYIYICNNELREYFAKYIPLVNG